ncbi:MAG TPA: hypothetical protein VMJ64_04610 [Anaerolineales bacterium]|nr:hypothetical protein [Anaerolineales bacterium]
MERDGYPALRSIREFPPDQPHRQIDILAHNNPTSAACRHTRSRLLEPAAVLKPVHTRIMRRALEGRFSSHALAVVLEANLWVDSIPNLLGHEELHFDNNAFECSRAYIEQQRATIRPSLERGQPKPAWEAFGRLTHTAQDFYAHSNYVDLWLACQRDGIVPSASEIDPVDDALIENPSLRSGKMYFPLGLLSFVPGLKRFVIPRMPRDSHAWMNLDSEARGPMFEYAFHAAVKRTRFEFDDVARTLTLDLYRLFTDLP